MNTLLHVWKVAFDYRFESSSGMERYQIPRRNINRIVLTHQDSIQAVRAATQELLSPQEKFTTFHAIEYLGPAAQPLNPTS